MRFGKTKMFIFSAIFMLFAYIGIGVFGLLQYNSMAEMPMADCPYAQNSYALCENVLDHIADWQQFSNVTIPSLLMFSLLILGIVIYFFDKQNILNQVQRLFYKWKYYINSKFSKIAFGKIIRYLSLFENSPSRATLRYVRAFS